MDWPDDADGDVMRRLQKESFNFSQEVEVDFNIDFKSWPPAPEFLEIIANRLPNAKISVQEDYVLVQVLSQLSYPFVLQMQSDLSDLARSYGGICESWGLLREPN